MINIKNIVLGIGIAIVFGLTLWQGIEAFYSTPEYKDFCGEFKTTEEILTMERCEENGGRWNSYDGERAKPIVEDQERRGWCDRDFTCRAEYESAKDDHSKIVFIVALVVGLITLVIGYGILSVEPVGSALIGSGIWAIFWGSAINWRNFSDIWRFLLLFLALVLIIWLALRINKKTKKRGFFSRLFRI